MTPNPFTTDRLPAFTHALAEVTVAKGVRTSPKEHEWLSDLSPKHIAAISKLLKSKNTKELERYLLSNRLMDRDGLVHGKNLDRGAVEIIKRSFSDMHETVSIFSQESPMSRFSNETHRSLNESIQNLNSNNRISELEEYVDMLESVLLSIAEEMECDTDELVEMAMSGARQKQLAGKIKKQDPITTKAADAARTGNKSVLHRDEVRKSKKLGRQYEKEGESKKKYGLHGKILKSKTSMSRSSDARDVYTKGGWHDQTTRGY